MSPEKEFLHRLNEIEHVAYCVNQFDEASSSVGSFIYDVEMFNTRATYWALSRVFEYPDDLFNWARAHGFRCHCVSKRGWIGRKPC